MYKIYIPTKNRANSKYLPKIIKALEVKATLVVEPQDLESYKKIFKDVVYYEVLGGNDNGYNYALYHIYNKIYREKEIAFILDDDITSIYLRKNRKAKNMGIVGINECMKYMVETSPYVVTYLMFKWFIWSMNTDYKDSGRISAFVLVKGSELTKDVMETFNSLDIKKYRLYGDIMMSASLYKNGVNAGGCCKYGLNVTPMGKNEGGCHVDYTTTNQNKLSSEAIYKLLGDNFCKLILKQGRYEIKVQWKKLYNSKYNKQRKLF